MARSCGTKAGKEDGDGVVGGIYHVRGGFGESIRYIAGSTLRMSRFVYWYGGCKYQKVPVCPTTHRTTDDVLGLLEVGDDGRFAALGRIHPDIFVVVPWCQPPEA